MAGVTLPCTDINLLGQCCMEFWPNCCLTPVMPCLSDMLQQCNQRLAFVDGWRCSHALHATHWPATKHALLHVTGVFRLAVAPDARKRNGLAISRLTSLLSDALFGTIPPDAVTGGKPLDAQVCKPAICSHHSCCIYLALLCARQSYFQNGHCMSSGTWGCPCI